MMAVATVPQSPLRGDDRRNEPLARYTSWRCGGKADRLYIPSSRDDLAEFVRELSPTEPLTAIGLGSNLLVRDGGVRGTVVVLHPGLSALEWRDGLVYAEAGVVSPKVARFAALHERADAEFLSGIPGTTGGALAMNAGCYGGETWRYVVQVEVLTRAGAFERRLPTDYVIGYRSVRRADGRGQDDLFTAAWYGFPPGDMRVARARIKQLLERRLATQPLEIPNAGSVFRNPPNDYAARLIETCGLKGHAVGAARVSEKHANFIVNPGGRASATDIETLIGDVRTVVRDKTGVDLMPEIQIIGEAQRQVG
jgi:UDP-N-acetylmuramate dehydrogenase